MTMLTQAQILEELEQAIAATGEENIEGAYTTRDLSRMLGLSTSAIRVRLQVLSEAGRLETATVTRTNIAGVPQPRTAYRILPTQPDGS